MSAPVTPTLVAVVRLEVDGERVNAKQLVTGITDNHDIHEFAWQAAANLATALKLLCGAYGADIDVVLRGMGLVAAEADL